MKGAVVNDSDEVAKRLKGLGLSQLQLHEAVTRGQLAYLSCSRNHPPMVPGIWAWGETVRALREILAPSGWKRSDERNYSVVVSAENIAIAVCAGNEATGQPSLTPSNKAPKGPSTQAAIEDNRFQLSLNLPIPVLSEAGPSSEEDDNRNVTWILLVFRTLKEVRCELSLPSAFDGAGHILEWKERILLDPLPLDQDALEIEAPELADIEVRVNRKR